MTTLSAMQRTIAQNLETNQEFIDFCTLKVGEKLNSYTDSSILVANETLPFVTTHKINRSLDNNEEPEWIMQILIGIEADQQPIEDNGVMVFPTTTIVEELADKALELTSQELACFGVDGELNFRVASYNILISQIGEAEDILCIVTLTVKQYALL